LLIVLGLALLVLEVKVPSFGVLGVGGIVALIAGGVMITNEVPGIAVNYRGVVATAVGAGVVVLLLGRLALRAQRQPAATGLEAMVGEQGSALSVIAPDTPGQVSVHGEIWRANSSTPIAVGDRVRVIAVNGLTLTVSGAESPLKQGDTP
jgi:membrane-bound serine protease (ClpP class)